MTSRALVVLIVFAIAVLAGAERQQLLIHRIGPATSTIVIADGDGSHERILLAAEGFDYNGSLSADGAWVAFTSERQGSADIYRVRVDGSGVERLTDDPAYDDQAALSPDGTKVAFVSTRHSGTTDVWIMDLATRQSRNVSRTPGGDFRPSWSPDGQRIAFSSDRGTEVERKAPAWEHLQRTSIYIAQADGTGVRRLTSGERFAGTPSWSPDGRRIAFYEMAVDDTHEARTNGRPDLVSQIVSVDSSGGSRREHTSGPGLKLSPQFVGADRIGYLAKTGPRPGIAYTTGEVGTAGDVRNPAWSAEGARLVFDRGLAGAGRRNWSQLEALFSHDATIGLSHSSSLSAFSRDGRSLASSEQIPNTGNREYAITVRALGEPTPRRVFYEKGAAAMAPQWSPDGQWIVFGLGPGFESRNAPAKILMMHPDGSALRTLATGPGAGFPSFSPDGTRIVYRVWGPGPDERGLRVLSLETASTTRITSTDYDTFPSWSPTSDLIAFSSWRKGDFDIFTIKSDGTGLKQLTTVPGNDAHSSWSPDGRSLMFSSSRYGFKDEAPLLDGQPQPYGEIFIMNADGSGQRPLTDNQWEDGPGAWQPAGSER